MCGPEVCIFLLVLLLLFSTVLIIVLLSQQAVDPNDLKPKEPDLDKANAEYSQPGEAYPFTEEEVPMVKKLRNDIESLKAEIADYQLKSMRLERKVDFYPLRDMVEANSIEDLKTEVLLSGTTTKKDFVIGITATISRDSVGMLYLIQTIQRLIAGIPPERHKDFLIIVLNSDPDFLRSSSLNIRIKKHFSNHTASGLVKVVRVDPHVYPPQLIYDPCSLYNNFDDTLSRVKWASKIAIDVTYVMELASQIGKYYIHLEDDTPPVANWFSLLDRYMELLDVTAAMTDVKLRRTALSTGGIVIHDPHPHHQGWFMLRMSHDKELPVRMGRMFGLVFKANELPDYIKHIRRTFDQVPVDWNTGFYIHERGWRNRVFSLKKPIFAHIGKVSTKGQKNAAAGAKVILYGEYVDWKQCYLDNPNFVMRKNETVKTVGNRLATVDSKFPRPSRPQRLAASSSLLFQPITHCFFSLYQWVPVRIPLSEIEDLGLLNSPLDIETVSFAQGP